MTFCATTTASSLRGASPAFSIAAMMSTPRSSPGCTSGMPGTTDSVRRSTPFIDQPLLRRAVASLLASRLVDYREDRNNQIRITLLERHRHPLSDRKLLVRCADDVREHAQTSVELDKGHVVRHAHSPVRMVSAVDDDVGQKLAASRQ